MPLGDVERIVTRTGIDNNDLIGDAGKAFQAGRKVVFFVLNDEDGAEPGVRTLGFVMTYCFGQRPDAPSGRSAKRSLWQAG